MAYINYQGVNNYMLPERRAIARPTQQFDPRMLQQMYDTWIGNSMMEGVVQLLKEDPKVPIKKDKVIVAPKPDVKTDTPINNTETPVLPKDPSFVGSTSPKITGENNATVTGEEGSFLNQVAKTLNQTGNIRARLAQQRVPQQKVPQPINPAEPTYMLPESKNPKPNQSVYNFIPNVNEGPPYFYRPPLLQNKNAANPIQNASPESQSLNQQASFNNNDWQSNYTAPLPPKKYLDLFTNVAAKYGVPVELLTAMAYQESSYGTNNLGSPTKYGRAKGMFQFIDDTADSLGINPHDPKQAAEGAARLLLENYQRYGNWDDAVSAYHGGTNRENWGPITRNHLSEIKKHIGAK